MARVLCLLALAGAGLAVCPPYAISGCGTTLGKCLLQVNRLSNECDVIRAQNPDTDPGPCDMQTCTDAQIANGECYCNADGECGTNQDLDNCFGTGTELRQDLYQIIEEICPKCPTGTISSCDGTAGHCLQPLADDSPDCPVNSAAAALLPDCNDPAVVVGAYCESQASWGDGPGECGTQNINNCNGNYDVFRLVAAEPCPSSSSSSEKSLLLLLLLLLLLIPLLCCCCLLLLCCLRRKKKGNDVPFATFDQNLPITFAAPCATALPATCAFGAGAPVGGVEFGPGPTFVQGGF